MLIVAGPLASAGTYTVKPGDTLWRIAQSHNVSVEALQRANNMGDSGVVIVGQVLTIPGAGGAQPSAPAPPRPAPAPTQAAGGQHVVQPGETLYSIATQYRTTVAALRQLNELAEDAVLVSGRTLRIPSGRQPAPSAPAAPSGPGTVWHEIQRGDTLSAISRRYGVSITQLESWNSITRDAPLIAGSRLRVGAADGPTAAPTPSPPTAAGGRSYTVVRGDTLSSIARAHNVRVAELASVNQIPNDAMVRIGQTLRLPANATAPVEPAELADTTPPAGAPAVEPETPEIAQAEPVERPQPAEQPMEPARPEPVAPVDDQPEVATAQPAPADPPAADPAISDDTQHGATTDALDAFFSYEIQPEQTLAEVAEIFATTEAELLRVNPRMQSADQAKPGDRILVPGEGLKKRFAGQF